jgi:hypothetical protein
MLHLTRRLAVDPRACFSASGWAGAAPPAPPPAAHHGPNVGPAGCWLPASSARLCAVEGAVLGGVMGHFVVGLVAALIVL